MIEFDRDGELARLRRWYDLPVPQLGAADRLTIDDVPVGGAALIDGVGRVDVRPMTHFPNEYYVPLVPRGLAMLPRRDDTLRITHSYAVFRLVRILGGRAVYRWSGNRE